MSAEHGKLFSIHLDAVTLARYERISLDMGRSIEDLIEIAAEEAALEYAKTHGMLVPVRTDSDRLDGAILGGVDR